VCVLLDALLFRPADIMRTEQAFDPHRRFYSGARICRKEPFAHGDVKHSPEHSEFLGARLPG